MNSVQGVRLCVEEMFFASGRRAGLLGADEPYHLIAFKEDPEINLSVATLLSIILN